MVLHAFEQVWGLNVYCVEKAGWEHKGYDSFGNRVDFKATAEYINMILENVVELAISGDFLQYRNVLCSRLS